LPNIIPRKKYGLTPYYDYLTKEYSRVRDSDKLEQSRKSVYDTKRIDILVREAYARHLRIIGPVLCGYYGLLALSHSILLPVGVKLPMVGFALLASLFGLAVSVLVFSGRLRLRQVHVVGFSAAALAMVNIFLHINLVADEKEMFNAALGLIGMGFLVLSPQVYVVLMVCSLGAYISTMVHLGAISSPQLSFMAITGTALSLMAFVSLYRHVVAQAVLVLDNRLRRYDLYREKKTVELASAAKSRFLANTSHELRTPLTGIMGMLELLRTTQLNAEQQKLLSVAEASSESLLRIINDILDSAALESGRLRLVPDGFDFDALIDGIFRIMQPVAAEKRLYLRLEAPAGGVPLMVGDRGRVGQVVLNLLSNAVKFTKSGDVVLGYQFSGEDPVSIELWVRDSGPGIPAADLPHLFERFQRLEGSEAARESGTGLGLAICREILSLMGGSISVRSEPGIGSEFRIALDLPVDRRRPAQSRGAVMDAAARLSMAENMPLRILVAEDNKVNQLLISKILAQKASWQVTMVADGVEAVEAVVAAAQPFDMLLLDIQMPHQDGMSALTEMRARLGGRCPPAIALTANVSAEDQQQYRAVGFAEVAGKPIDQRALFEHIAEYVDIGPA